MEIGVQILNKVNCIYDYANTLGKYMNPTILSPAMDKIIGQTGLLSLSRAIGREEEEEEKH